MAQKYEALCQEILKGVGGQENMVYAQHCETRLRFQLKDRSLVNQDALKEAKGILGCQFVGDQFQIIIGQHVHDVYKEFCVLTGITETAQVDENLDVNKKSVKYWFNKIVLDVISGCIMPLLPIFVGAGIIKMIDTNIPISMFLAAVMIHPTLMGLVSEGTAFTVYGIPMTPVTYSSQFLPTILSVWILSYVYRFLNEHTPNSIKMAVVPTVSMLIMLPITLCVVGPLGSFVGVRISDAAVWLSEVFGPLAVGLIGGLWYFLVGLGMDKALVPVVVGQFATYGYDALFWLSAICATYALMGVGLAYLFLGGFCGGTVAFILGAKAHTLGTGNILFFTTCAGGDGSSLVPAIIACSVAFAVSFGLALVFGFEGRRKPEKKAA